MQIMLKVSTDVPGTSSIISIANCSNNEYDCNIIWMFYWLTILVLLMQNRGSTQPSRKSLRRILLPGTLLIIYKTLLLCIADSDTLVHHSKITFTYSLIMPHWGET